MAKKQLLNFFHVFSSGLPIRTYAKLTGKNLFMPFYHAVSNDNPTHIRHIYPVRTEKLFRQDLDFILSQFCPIDLQNILEVTLRGEKPAKPVFHLTFDDGLSEVYHLIAPILLEKGVPATFFVNSSFVDNIDLFFRYKVSLILEKVSLGISNSVIENIRDLLPNSQNHQTDLRQDLLFVKYENRAILDQIAILLEIDFHEFLREKKPYMTSEQIMNLQKKGFSIGAHSVDHPEYNRIPIADQIDQTMKSIEFVTNTFSPSIRSFAFPFTDYGVSKEFFQSIYAVDNRGVDLSFGGAGLKNDCIELNLQRFPMEDTLLPAKKLISSEYLYYIFKMPFGKNTIRRK